jgi:hypothetical protein
MDGKRRKLAFFPIIANAFSTFQIYWEGFLLLEDLVGRRELGYVLPLINGVDP